MNIRVSQMEKEGRISLSHGSKTYLEVLVYQVISIFDTLKMLVKALLTPLKHLMLEIKVSDMFCSFLSGQGGTFILLLLNLFLELLELHASVLLFDLLLMLLPLCIHLTVILKSVDSLDFCLVLHDFTPLLGCIRSCLILQCLLPTS